MATEADTTGSGSYNDIEHYILDVSPETPVAGQPGTALADPMFIINQNGAITARLFNGPGAGGRDMVIDQEAIQTPGQAGTDGWTLVDNLNTGRYIINDNSAVVDHIMATSFGRVTGESNPSIAHWAGFEGGHLDVFTGLVNDYHRWYDPASVRWLSDDPIGFLAGDANLSRYVGNAALDGKDSTGLVGEDWVITTVGGQVVKIFVPYVGTFWGVTAVEDAIAAQGLELTYMQNSVLSGIIEAAEEQGAAIAMETTEAASLTTKLAYGGLYAVIAAELVLIVVEIKAIKDAQSEMESLQATYLAQATQFYVGQGYNAQSAAQMALQEQAAYNASAPSFGATYGYYFYQDYIGWWSGN